MSTQGGNEDGAARDLPDFDQLDRIDGTPSAWGVWGDGDVFGALGLLDASGVVGAAGLIQKGSVFAMNWSLALPDPPLFNREAIGHEVVSNIISSDDHITSFNTQGSTQWDGFRHIRHPVHGHFGGSASEGKLGIDHWARRGIVGRAILADLGRWRDSQGRPIQHDAGEAIPFSEVESALAEQGTEVKQGDILLIRTGWIGWYESLDADARSELAEMASLACTGLAPGMGTVAALWNAHVSAVASDNPSVEAWPPGSQLEGDGRSTWFRDSETIEASFAHTLLLPMMGIPIGEMFVLDALADDCAADGRYEFFFASAPLNLPAGVASPPNALAIK